MGLMFAETVEKVLPAARRDKTNVEAPIIETGVISFLLRLFVQSIHDMQEGVAGCDVVPRLDATLGVDSTADVGEVAEEVEAVEHTDEVAVEETLRKAGVPNKLVGVHGMVGVTSTGVHGEVGGEL